MSLPDDVIEWPRRPGKSTIDSVVSQLTIEKDEVPLPRLMKATVGLYKAAFLRCGGTATRRQIACELGMEKDSIKGTLKNLIAHKYVEVSEVTGNGTKMYKWVVQDIPNVDLRRLYLHAIRLKETLAKARDHLDYCGYGDSWEREVAMASNLEEEIDGALKVDIDTL